MSWAWCVGYLIGQCLALILVNVGFTLKNKWDDYKIEKECRKNREKYHKEKGEQNNV